MGGVGGGGGGGGVGGGGGGRGGGGGGKEPKNLTCAGPVLVVGCVALRPKSTAGRSVHLTTLFPGQA